MKYYLFLDDVRRPKDAFLYDKTSKLSDYTKIPDESWKVVRTYDEFVDTVNKFGIPSVVSFDCDLCENHVKYYMKEGINTGVYEWENFSVKCGIHCANFLKSRIKDENIEVTVHSANHIGRAIIKNIFKDNLL